MFKPVIRPSQNNLDIEDAIHDFAVAMLEGMEVHIGNPKTRSPFKRGTNSD